MTTFLTVAAAALAAAAGLAAVAAAPAAADGLPLSNPCWSWQLPLPQGNDTPGIDFIDTHEGWEAGAGGLILHTSDGGMTWERQASGVEWDLTAVAFADADHGWASGDGGFRHAGATGILHTADGGATWTVQRTGPVNDLCVTGASEAWAVAGGDFLEETPAVVLHTVDGGTTWSSVALPGLRTHSDYFNAASFADADHGVIVGGRYTVTPDGGYGGGHPLCYSTADGGATWTHTVLDTSDWIEDFSDVDAASPNVYWADTWGGLFKSTDGGATWTKPPLPDDARWLGSVTFLDADHGWGSSWSQAAGSRVFRTSDGGATWAAAAAPDLYDVTMDFTSPTDGWLTGDGWTARTSDGGATWTMLSPQPTGMGLEARSLSDLAFADDSRGIAVGYQGQILRTDDGGQTWARRPSGTTTNLFAAAFPTSERAWALGGRKLALRSGDGGLTWSPLHPASLVPLDERALCSGLHFRTLAAFDADHAMITARNADRRVVVLRTADGGSTWRCRALGDPHRDVVDASSLDAHHGWLLLSAPGRHGRIDELWSTSDGIRWTRVGDIRTARNDIGAICFTDVDKGWAATGDGPLLRTHDGGKTWTEQTKTKLPGWWRWPKDLVFTSASEGWFLYAIEDGPTILMHTRDGGAHWSAQETGLQGGGYAAVFHPGGQGWMLGGNGGIIHTGNGGGSAPLTFTDLPAAVYGAHAYNHPVTIHLSAWDAGSGVATTEYSVEHASHGWQDLAVVRPMSPGTRLDLLAAADHSNDGHYLITYRSTDLVGTRAFDTSVWVTIDTIGPRCVGARPCIARRGTRTHVAFWVLHAAFDECVSTIVIRNATGHVVKKITQQEYPGGQWAPFVCRLPRGHYTYKVTAVDLAGNPQTETTGSTLTVR